jgi:hypothetical protein
MQGYGPPVSNLPPSIDDAKLPEQSKTPSINTLTKIFFIDFSPGVQKLLAASFHCTFSIPYNPLTLLGISESGTDFSQNGNLEEGRPTCCLLEHSQVKTVELLKSHFGTDLRKSFTFSAGRL